MKFDEISTVRCHIFFANSRNKIVRKVVLNMKGMKNVKIWIKYVSEKPRDSSDDGWRVKQSHVISDDTINDNDKYKYRYKDNYKYDGGSVNTKEQSDLLRISVEQKVRI